MKRFQIALMFIFIVSGPAFAGETMGPHVHVVGHATEEVTPDEMTWYLVASNIDLDLLKVATDHRSAVNSVLTLLKSIDVPEDKIQTTRMSYGENLVHRAGQRVKEGYLASTAIVFTLTNFNNYNQLWIELTKIPGISIKNVVYDTSKREELEETVRVNALKNAKEKASAHAQTLSAQIGNVLMIDDKSAPIIQRQTLGQYEPYYLRTAYSVGGSAPQIPVALGKIPVSQNIDVIFRLKTAGN